ncbi:Patr class I histocompatibility antigen [Striga asiatica]|uniref:Patr class I histocompatibility antigen n=1 Tax=Striga asiatica TaxID=4170 RepID=A0A5A7PYU2_STRAF|nr:Patr class I histocompatibility antigen [Striga asiatica]
MKRTPPPRQSRKRCSAPCSSLPRTPPPQLQRSSEPEDVQLPKCPPAFAPLSPWVASAMAAPMTIEKGRAAKQADRLSQTRCLEWPANESRSQNLLALGSIRLTHRIKKSRPCRRSP